MVKKISGKVVSTKMINTVVIEVTRRFPHPKYKKLLKRSKKFKAALNGHTVAVGDVITITETRPIAKDVHFAVSGVVTTKGDSK